MALRLWGIRTAIRHTPADQTPFSLRVTPTGVDLLLDDQILVRDCEILEPEASCLKNLAYFSDGIRRDRDTSITINPIQSCPMRCLFCRRQYDQRESPLLNLSPADAARHLVSAYALDWTSGMQISIVTATFDLMFQFTREFAASRALLTDGGYDPPRRPRQNIHLLTHVGARSDRGEPVRERPVRAGHDHLESRPVRADIALDRSHALGLSALPAA